MPLKRQIVVLFNDLEGEKRNKRARKNENENFKQFLNGLTKITLPKKIEKRKENCDTTPALSQKRGSNRAKHKVYHNIEEFEPIL